MILNMKFGKFYCQELIAKLTYHEPNFYHRQIVPISEIKPNFTGGRTKEV